MKKTTWICFILTVMNLSAEAATVSGRVQLTGRAAKAKVVTMVYAEPLDRQPIQPGAFRMSQRDKTFSPSVLAVPAGSTVGFPNDDLVFHNVFSLSRPAPFDLGLYRAGASKSRIFSTQGIYRIFCNIHPQMTAVVLVLPTAYFTQADASGNFSLEVPPGRYRITAWSERAQPGSAEITVTATPLTVSTLSLNESTFLEAGHRNKYGLEYPAIAYDPMRDRKPR